jgi:hypothetical protein
MKEYTGACHCGSIRFRFSAPLIDGAVRCNCSICRKKGAAMTRFTVAPSDMTLVITNGSLATYEFGQHAAKHHFCRKCGIYTFHQTLGQAGHYRINIGCIEGVDDSVLPVENIDGAAL